MTEVPHSAAAGTPASLLTTSPPWEELHMQAHSILVVVIFCLVCLLLLVAFLYATCIHCSTASAAKDTGAGCSLEREDATYRGSSSENPSVWNTV